MISPYAEGFFSTFKPQAAILPSQWAEQNRILPMDGSAEPGPWRNSRTPYLVEIMDSLAVTSRVREVAFCKGTQIGATEAALNWLMYLIDHVGGPILATQPTKENAIEWSVQRIGPSFTLCNPVNNRLRPHRHTAGDALLRKDFLGCQLFLSGMNSPNAAAGKPIGNYYGDEVTRYPGDLGGEGDPLYLIGQRLSTFPFGKLFFTSTPKIKGSCRIWDLYEKSDQRVYDVPCPVCGHYQEIVMANLVWEKGSYNSVKLRCINESCNALIAEFHKTKMLLGGRWRAKNPGHSRIGFHLSSLYSPLGWLSWGDVARKFDEAQGDPGKMQAFTNTILGLPWEETGESISAEYLSRRVETYKAQVPDGVLAVTMAVDVQKDRIECEVVGWGEAEESWGIQYRVFRGDPGLLRSADPSNPSVWEQLTEFRDTRFRCADGYEFVACCCTIDSGGDHTDLVYRYAWEHRRENVYAIKGGSQPTRPFMARPTLAGRPRVRLFVLGVHQGKRIVFDRLLIDKPGPGYCHFPDDENTGYNAHVFAGLINERYVEETKNGVKRAVWKLPKGAHNEPFDLRNYNLAALRIRSPNWERLKERRWNGRPASATVATVTTSSAAPEPTMAPQTSGPKVIENSPTRQTVRNGIQLLRG